MYERREPGKDWTLIERKDIPNGVLMAFDFIPTLDDVKQADGIEYRRKPDDKA
jgi:hypothetical protein